MGNTKRNDKYDSRMRVGKLETLLTAALVGGESSCFMTPGAQTAAMPAFLRYLRDNHYRVVHVVSAAPATHPMGSRQSRNQMRK
jgi:hypothetical protein